MWGRAIAVGLLAAPVLLGAQAPARDAAPAADATEPRGTSTIRGRVADAQSGRPLRGVIVSVYATERAYQGAVTDGAGRYEISGIPPGKVKVNALLPVIATTAEKEVEVVADKATDVDLQIHFDQKAYASAHASAVAAATDGGVPVAPSGVADGGATKP